MGVKIKKGRKIMAAMILYHLCCISISTAYGAESLFPVDIREEEGEGDGKKEVVKTYELSEEESPDDIPKESF